MRKASPSGIAAILSSVGWPLAVIQLGTLFGAWSLGFLCDAADIPGTPETGNLLS
jgi:hypothetical protein